MNINRKNFNLDNEAVARLEHLAERTGKSMSYIVQDAIKAYQQETDPVAATLQKVYRAVSKGIEKLEIIRDTDPETNEYIWQADGELVSNHLTPEGNALHEMLNRFWDELRTHPAFTEPAWPDDEHQGS